MVSHMAQRRSWKESTGGTGKYPPFTFGRCPLLPPSMVASLDQAASSEPILKKEPLISGFHFTSSNTKNSGSGPKKALSPIPVDLRYASARRATERGARL